MYRANQEPASEKALNDTTDKLGATPTENSIQRKQAIQNVLQETSYAE